MLFEAYVLFVLHFFVCLHYLWLHGHNFILLDVVFHSPTL